MDYIAKLVSPRTKDKARLAKQARNNDSETTFSSNAPADELARVLVQAFNKDGLVSEHEGGNEDDEIEDFGETVPAPLGHDSSEELDASKTGSQSSIYRALTSNEVLWPGVGQYTGAELLYLSGESPRHLPYFILTPSTPLPQVSLDFCLCLKYCYHHLVWHA